MFKIYEIKKDIEIGNIILEKGDKVYILLNEGKSFIIPKIVPKDLFNITNSFKDAKKWKVKVLQSNSGSKKIGTWDDVGYVMFNLKTNEIIPIARNDEHKLGYEIMWDYYNKKFKIKVANYVSIFIFGNNYIYERSQIEEMIIAVEKFLSYGGDPNLFICINTNANKIKLSMGEIIKYKGKIDEIYKDYTNVKGRVLAGGEQIINAWIKLSKLFQSSSRSFQKSALNKLVRETKNTMEVTEDSFTYSFFGPENRDLIISTMFDMVKYDGTYGDLENFVFGFLKDNDVNKKIIQKNWKYSKLNFTGVKNTYHNQFREEAKKEGGLMYDDMKSAVGDIEMFVKKFGSI